MHLYLMLHSAEYLSFVTIRNTSELSHLKRFHTLQNILFCILFFCRIIIIFHSSEISYFSLFRVFLFFIVRHCCSSPLLVNPSASPYILPVFFHATHVPSFYYSRLGRPRNWKKMYEIRNFALLSRKFAKFSRNFWEYVPFRGTSQKCHFT